MSNEPVAWGMPRPDGAILDCITPEEHAKAEGGYTVPLYTQSDTALLRQVLNDLCGSRLCEVNSMSSREEAKRLIDKAITALRERLGEKAWC